MQAALIFAAPNKRVAVLHHRGQRAPPRTPAWLGRRITMSMHAGRSVGCKARLLRALCRCCCCCRCSHNALRIHQIRGSSLIDYA